MSEACDEDEPSCSSGLLSRKAVKFAQRIEPEGRAVRMREGGGGRRHKNGPHNSWWEEKVVASDIEEGKAKTIGDGEGNVHGGVVEASFKKKRDISKRLFFVITCNQ